MHLKYAEMLAIFVHHNMKLGDNNSEWWEALTSKHEITDKKKLRIVALILLPYNISIILRLKDDMKPRLISRISNS